MLLQYEYKQKKNRERALETLADLVDATLKMVIKVTLLLDSRTMNKLSLCMATS